MTASPAYAGFQWVAPSDSQPVSTSGYAAQPRASNGPDIISPVVITGDSNPTASPPPPAPAYAAPAYQQQPAAYQPAYTAPTYPSPAYAPAPSDSAQPPPTSMANATIAVPPGAGGDVVQGFASQVPLTLALRQILPVGTNFSIDQTVDMNTPVSYKGGKSWRETLRDMLAPLGLAAHEQGDTVMVGRAAAMAQMPVAAPMPSSGAPIPLQASDQALPASRLPLSATMGRSMAEPAAFAAEAQPINVGSPDGWSASRGDTLRKVLTDWCHRSGAELQWLAEYDYPMEASAHFSGSFEDAVRNLLAGFENARPQPVAELHTNTTAGQMLLVIQARGNNYSN